mgnify:CR=1 FL=1
MSKTSNISESELIQECKKGSLKYQEMLYKHFYGYALSICRLYTYSDDDAVSILNDSFLKVFSAIQKKGYNDAIPFKNWLRRILINTAIDNYRKNSRRKLFYKFGTTTLIAYRRGRLLAASQVIFPSLFKRRGRRLGARFWQTAVWVFRWHAPPGASPSANRRKSARERAPNATGSATGPPRRG